MYLTGLSENETYQDAATVAYATANGSQLWADRYDGPAARNDSGWSLDVSQDGASVFVTGGADGSSSGSADWNIFTAGYSSADGDLLWKKVVNGPDDGYDFGRSLAISPDGTKVYVLGHSLADTAKYDVTTVAYALATGKKLWIERVAGPKVNSGLVGDIEVTPDGSRVVLTSYRTKADTTGYLTVSYTKGGALRWSRWHKSGSYGRGNGLALNPNGRKAYVTGGAAGGLTIAYKT